MDTSYIAVSCKCSDDGEIIPLTPAQFIQWACLSIASLCEEFNEINEQGGSLLYFSSSPLSVWSSKERFCQPE